MIEVILSPNLRLAQREDERKRVRLAATKHFAIGQRVKAGPSGKLGALEGISANGFASIRWDDGGLLCGVEADCLLPHDSVEY